MSLFFLNTPVLFSAFLLAVVFLLIITVKSMAKIVSIGLLLLGLSYPIIHYHVVYNFHINYASLQKKLFITGDVIRVDEYKYSYRVTLRPQKIDNQAIAFYKRLKIHLYIQKSRLKSQGKVITEGDKITTQAKLKPITSVVNPFIYDTRLYHFVHGLKYKASIGVNSPLTIKNTRQHSNLEQVLDKSNYAWAYKAVLFGQSYLIPKEVQQVIKQLGISHLFAVSGLHMGIVFFLCWWAGNIIIATVNKPLKLHFHTSKLISCSIAVIGCAVYLDLSHYSTSALRAFIMTTMFCICFLFAKHRISLRSLLFAFVITLLINPFLLVTIGLYFSFLAVFVILLMVDLMKKLNINNRIIKVIIVQFAITLLLLPLGGFYFNGVSLFSILINLIAIPLFSIVVMPTLLFAAIIAEVLGSPLIVLYIEPSLAYLVDFLLSIKSKQLWLYLPAISWQMLIFVTFSMIMGIVFFKSVFITLPIVSIYILSIYFEKEPLTIQVFDVGHGLSVMIYKDGQAVLYDLAARYDSFSYFNYVIYPTLKSKDLTLTKTIISHDDNDHSGGKHDLINKGLGNTLISDNDKCDFNQFLLASVRFSSIVQQGSYKSDNNNSCVVKVSTENFSLLLTGDIEIERENELLNYQFDTAIDVMISPHHGSNTSSSAAFIKHTSPSWVIHSVNLNNRWKLPSHHVVERYSQHGTKQISTQQGAITIKVYAEHYEISRYKSKRKYWFITHENA